MKNLHDINKKKAIDVNLNFSSFALSTEELNQAYLSISEAFKRNWRATNNIMLKTWDYKPSTKDEEGY